MIWHYSINHQMKKKIKDNGKIDYFKIKSQ